MIWTSVTYVSGMFTIQNNQLALVWINQVYEIHHTITKSRVWFKHILLINTKGLGVAKLRRKRSPIYTHTFTPLNTYTKK